MNNNKKTTNRTLKEIMIENSKAASSKLSKSNKTVEIKVSTAAQSSSEQKTAKK